MEKENNNIIFISIGLLAIIAIVFFAFYSPNQALKTDSQIEGSNIQTSLQGQENQGVAETNKFLDSETDDSILCNGKYYTQCSDKSLKFICPKTGEAYCEPIQQQQNNTVPSNSLLCNGKYWSPCPAGYVFSCPSQGDAKCLTQNSISSGAATTGGSTSSEVERLLQEQISKQNSWYEEYLRKQAEIDKMLKPINEEEHRITEQYSSECIQFVTGQKAQECDALALRLNQLEAEASRISGIYPERKTLPQSPTPKYEQWKFSSTTDGLSGTIWSPYSTTQYKWRCINTGNCTLESY
jgi:hypothetical protein